MAILSERLSDVDIRLLRVFVAIVEHGGVTAAANALNVDRSTISRQLSELEDRLDLRLCERSRSGFWLTDEGRVVRDKAQDLLASLREFHRHVREIHKELEGEFVIAVADAYIWEPRLALAQTLRALKADAPGVEPTVQIFTPDEVVRTVYNRTCHAGIMAVLSRRNHLAYWRLFEEALCLYCGPSHRFFGETKPIPVKELRSERFVTLPYESGTGALMQKFNLQPGPKTNSMEGVATLVSSGLFLGFMPDYYGRLFERQGTMKPVPCRGLSQMIEVCAFIHESEQHMKINSLFIKRLLAEMTAR